MARSDTGGPALIEGRNAVREALRAGVPLGSILVAEGTDPDRVLDEIVALAAQAGVPVRRVGRRRLDEKSDRGAHQGVIAEAAPFKFTSLNAALAPVREKPRSIVVVLDHVTDPGNLGAIARSAEVAGADALVVPRHRSAAITPAAWKASAGALAYLPVAEETNVARALEALKEADYWVAGADAGATQNVWEAPLDGRIALVMGAEGAGLSRLVRERCDFLVKLPQGGRVESLNVAQATTAILWEWLRRGEVAGS